MNTAVKIKTKSTVKEGTAYKELSKGVMVSVTLMAALIGAWGMVCFISAIAQFGPTGMASGFLTAIGF